MIPGRMWESLLCPAPEVFFMPHSRSAVDTMGVVIRSFLGAILNLSVYPQLSYSHCSWGALDEMGSGVLEN